jgi:hypothetical protein
MESQVPPTVSPLALSPAAAALKPAAPQAAPESASKAASEAEPALSEPVPETGGPKGPEPTRFGDWEKKGRCSDF